MEQPMVTNSFQNSEEQGDSVYLYAPENKDLYRDVLENFNNNDCIFSRNLLAYLEEEGRGEDSFHTKHLLTCSSCQNKAKKYRSMKHKIETSIPTFEFNEELAPMLRSEVKDAFQHFSKKAEGAQWTKINTWKLLKSSFVELYKGCFSSRELVLGLFMAAMMALVFYIFS